jgi:methyltransferase (TIGR00027 family)
MSGRKANTGHSGLRRFELPAPAGQSGGGGRSVRGATIDVARDEGVTITFVEGHVVRFDLPTLRSSGSGANVRPVTFRACSAWAKPDRARPTLHHETSEVGGVPVEDGQPSRTALGTAAARAAHLIVDRDPRIFDDTLALALLGDLAEDLVGLHGDGEDAESLACLRVTMIARSRYTEDRLVEAVRRGIGQCVVLGAGLDSFAFRSPLVGRLRVFEVDHPATQAWKRERLATAGIAVPSAVTFVPVDFRVDSLSERLVDMGFDRSQPAFVSWLGVTQYLTGEAIGATLDVIGGFAPGSELVISYLVPAEMRDASGQALADFYVPLAAAFGEPWLTFFTPSGMREVLAAHGLVVTEDVGHREQVDPSLWERSDGLRPHELGRLTLAVVAN